MIDPPLKSTLKCCSVEFIEYKLDDNDKTMKDNSLDDVEPGRHQCCLGPPFFTVMYVFLLQNENFCQIDIDILK